MKCEGGVQSNLTWQKDSTLLVPTTRTIITPARVGDIQRSLITRLRMTSQEAGLYECVDGNDPSNRAGITVHVTETEEARGRWQNARV